MSVYILCETSEKVTLMHVTNQQMHQDKICFIIYYDSPTCFGHFCNHHQGVTGEYKQYKTTA